MSGYAPNGNVIAANDSANGNWTYSYDPFNRLTGASQSSGSYSYVYDITGNRWQQNGSQSFVATFTGNNPSNPANNNRVDGYSYDAAGNLLNDGVHGYTYDAENRITQVDAGGTASYIYDANGRRIRKTMGGGSVDYLYGLSGNQIAEVSTSGTANREEVYAGGRHLATYMGGTTYFHHVDWLGTERVRSNISGVGCESISSLPFGDGQTITGGCGDPSPMHFTGQHHDPESNLHYFNARHFTSSMGRFMSPDPENVGATVDAPQSWNAYAYVLNNPLSFIDPTGLWCVWQDGTHDDIPDNGGADETTCINQGGAWDPTNSVTGCDSNWNCAVNNGSTTSLGAVCEDSYGCTLSGADSVTVTADAETENPYLVEIGRQLAPLNKLSDCTGLAVANEVPLGSQILGAKSPDRAGKASRFVSKATSSNPNGKLIPPLPATDAPGAIPWNYATNSQRATKALDAAGLPELADRAATVSARFGKYAPVFSKALGVFGWAYSAGNAAHNTYACYNKP